MYSYEKCWNMNKYIGFFLENFHVFFLQWKFFVVTYSTTVEISKISKENQLFKIFQKELTQLTQKTKLKYKLYQLINFLWNNLNWMSRKSTVPPSFPSEKKLKVERAKIRNPIRLNRLLIHQILLKLSI